MKIKGVVFDFNGTLFWDTELHNQAWDQFLNQRGFHLSYQEKVERIHGKNNQDFLAGLFPECSLEEIDRLSQEKEKIYQEICRRSNLDLAPGAREFIAFLKNNQISFTIATASDLHNVLFFFDYLKLDELFDRSKVVFNDGKTLSKPHPQMFQKAMQAIGTRPEQTLVFEDSLLGIQAAQNAGAGQIIIVNSNQDDHSRWNYAVIRDFVDVDRSLFVA